MAVKNTLLSGSDWDDGNFLNSADLNDTFDALYDEIVEFKN